MTAKFKNRADAGQALAKVLSFYQGKPDIIILALPRGGVPVAYETAKDLGLPLDIWLVRKLGVPGQEEYAMGAIAEGGIRYLNTPQIDRLQISKDQINEAEVFQKLPPLIKGYLRIGAKIGDGAVIDYDFNTVDVFITLPTSYVRDKYLKHYERTTQKTVAEHIFTSIPPLEKVSAQA